MKFSTLRQNHRATEFTANVKISYKKLRFALRIARLMPREPNRFFSKLDLREFFSCLCGSLKDMMNYHLNYFQNN